MRMRAPFLCLALAACGGTSSTTPTAPTTAPTTPTTPTAPPAGPPIARTVDTVDTLFGVRVADPYRWMEGNDNPERDTWMRAQGAHADAIFATIPKRDELLGRLRALGGEVASQGYVTIAGGRTFYFDIAAGGSLPVLEVREADGTERVLVDPTTIEGTGGHASLNSYSVSPDGETLAYDISTGGSEVSSIKLITVDTGATLADEIPRIWGEFPANWLPDGKSASPSRRSRRWIAAAPRRRHGRPSPATTTPSRSRSCMASASI